MLGGVVQARIATNHAEEMFRREREENEKQRRSEVTDYLLEESNLNKNLLERPYFTYTRVSLGVEAWLFARGSSGSLGSELAGKVRNLYAEMRRYNDLVLDERQKNQGVVHEKMVHDLQKQRESVTSLVDQIIPMLEKQRPMRA